MLKQQIVGNPDVEVGCSSITVALISHSPEIGVNLLQEEKGRLDLSWGSNVSSDNLGKNQLKLVFNGQAEEWKKKSWRYFARQDVIPFGRRSPRAEYAIREGKFRIKFLGSEAQVSKRFGTTTKSDVLCVGRVGGKQEKGHEIWSVGDIRVIRLHQEYMEHDGVNYHCCNVVVEIPQRSTDFFAICYEVEEGNVHVETHHAEMSMVMGKVEFDSLYGKKARKVS